MTLREVEAYALAHRFSLLSEHEGKEGWRRCRLDPATLRDMHGTFARRDFAVELEKGRRFGELFAALRVRIEEDDFPAAQVIRSPWPNKPAIYVQRTPHNGECYVCDGEARTLNALYNGEAYIDALLIDFDQRREVV